MVADNASDSLMELVRALARRQARLETAAGIQWDLHEEYRKDPSPENTALVVEHMTFAMELAFNVRRDSKGKARP